MRRTPRGAATAELVVALPVLVVLTVVLAWFVSIGIAQARVVDAARETARMLARGDDRAAALTRGREVGPAGTVVRIEMDADAVTVTATAQLHGPGGILRLVPVRLHARATAALEAPNPVS